MRRLFGQLGGMSSNDEMCSAMQAQRTIYSPGVARAFKAVDRAYFVSEAGDSESVEAAYTDMPLRHKYFHLSAPSIYGHALEALELSSGASFLNIGSGTGYFSALAANLIGVDAIHHGVEIQPRLVAHARSKLDSLGMHNIQLQTCTCFSIDPTSSMRFSRIYVGAGASQRSAELFFQLLEVGGVLVGPFSAYDGSQRLLKVVRTSELGFRLSEIMGVQFTPLISPQGFPVAAAASLRAPVWSPTMHLRFPPKYRDVVLTVLLLHNRHDTLFGLLPKELWLDGILPMLAHDAFSAKGARSSNFARSEARSNTTTSCDNSRSIADAAARAFAGALGPEFDRSDDEGSDVLDSEEESELAEEVPAAHTAEEAPAAPSPSPDVEMAEVAEDEVMAAAATAATAATAAGESGATRPPVGSPVGSPVGVLRRSRIIGRRILRLFGGQAGASGEGGSEDSVAPLGSSSSAPEGSLLLSA